MYTSHGWYIPGSTKTDETPKYRARCGGIGLCPKCSNESGIVLKARQEHKIAKIGEAVLCERVLLKSSADEVIRYLTRLIDDAWDIRSEIPQASDQTFRITVGFGGKQRISLDSNSILQVYSNAIVILDRVGRFQGLLPIDRDLERLMSMDGGKPLETIEIAMGDGLKFDELYFQNIKAFVSWDAGDYWGVANTPEWTRDGTHMNYMVAFRRDEPRIVCAYPKDILVFQFNKARGLVGLKLLPLSERYPVSAENREP